jgi:hypothetical protein
MSQSSHAIASHVAFRRAESGFFAGNPLKNIVRDANPYEKNLREALICATANQQSQDHVATLLNAYIWYERGTGPAGRPSDLYVKVAMGVARRALCHDRVDEIMRYIEEAVR